MLHVRAYRYQVTGMSGFQIPVYLLDADVSENQAWDRTLTNVLYGGDQYYRLWTLCSGSAVSGCCLHWAIRISRDFA